MPGVRQTDAGVILTSSGVAQTVVSEIPDSAVAQFLPKNYDSNNDDWPDEIGTIGTLSEGNGIDSTNTQNGEPTLVFTRQDRVETSSITGTISQPYTIIAAVNVTVDVSASGVESATYTDSTTTNDPRVLTQWNDSDFYAMESGELATGGGPVVTNEFVIMTAQFDGSNAEFRINASTEFVGDVGSGGIDSFRVGTDANEGNGFEGESGELLVYDNISDEDRDSEEQRLASKYGVTLS